MMRQTDRNWLFAAVTWCSGRVDHTRLETALTAWRATPSVPLPDYLVSQGLLSRDDSADLEARVSRHVARETLPAAPPDGPPSSLAELQVLLSAAGPAQATETRAAPPRTASRSPRHAVPPRPHFPLSVRPTIRPPRTEVSRPELSPRPSAPVLEEKPADIHDQELASHKVEAKPANPSFAVNTFSTPANDLNLASEPVLCGPEPVELPELVEQPVLLEQPVAIEQPVPLVAPDPLAEERLAATQSLAALQAEESAETTLAPAVAPQPAALLTRNTPEPQAETVSAAVAEPAPVAENPSPRWGEGGCERSEQTGEGRPECAQPTQSARTSLESSTLPITTALETPAAEALVPTPVLPSSSPLLPSASPNETSAWQRLAVCAQRVGAAWQRGLHWTAARLVELGTIIERGFQNVAHWAWHQGPAWFARWWGGVLGGVLLLVIWGLCRMLDASTASQEAERASRIQAEALAVQARATAQAAQQAQATESRLRAQEAAARAESERVRDVARAAEQAAEARRQQALGAQQTAETQRSAALAAEQAAEARRLEAVATAHEQNRRLVQWLEAQGHTSLAQAHPVQALQWYAAALRSQQAEATPAQWLRVQSLLRQAPRLVQAWSGPGPVWLRGLPEGQRVLMLRADGQAKITSVHNSQEKLLEFTVFPAGPVPSIRDLLLSPSGKLAAVVTDRAGLWTFDLQSGARLAGPFSSETSRALFSPDGERILGYGPRGTARLWSAKTGLPLGEPLVPADRALVQWAFSPDGEWLVGAESDGTLLVWDGLTVSPQTSRIRTLGPGVTHLGFSPDSRTLFSAHENGQVKFWDFSLGQTTSEPLGHAERPLAHVQLSPDGLRLLTAWTQGGPRIWDLAAGQAQVADLPLGIGVRSARFSPEGLRVLASCTDGFARVWDVRTGALLMPPLPLGSTMGQAEFSPQGRYLLTTSEHGQAKVWEAGTPWTVAGDDAPLMRSIPSPDGQLTLTCYEQGPVQIWRAATGEPVQELLVHPGPVVEARFSPDARLVLTVCQVPARPESSTGPHVEARVWDVASGKLSQNSLPQTLTARLATFSPDAKRLALLLPDGALKVWDLALGQATQYAVPPGKVIHDLQFGPSSDYLIAGCEISESKTGDVLFWETAGGQPLPVPAMSHADPVADLAVSPDGLVLVTCTTEGAVRLWDIASGQPRHAGRRLGGPVVKATFSRDGRWLLLESQVSTRDQEKNSQELLSSKVGAKSATRACVEVWSATTGEPVVPATVFSPRGPGSRAWFRADQPALALDDRFGPLSLPLNCEASEIDAVVDLASWLTGLGRDADGRFVPLTPSAEERLGRELRTRAVGPWSVALQPRTADEVFAAGWREAVECENQREWFAAAAILTQLLELRPDSWEVHLRRGNAWAELGEWSLAQAEQQRALELDRAAVLAWHREQVRAAQAEQHWEACIRSLNVLCEAQPQDAGLIAARAAALGELGDWERTLADLTQAITLRPQKDYYRDLAILCFWLDDRETYRILSEQLLEQAAANFLSAEPQVAWTCLLPRDALANPKLAARLATQGTATDSVSYESLLAQALVLCRAGRQADAIQRIETAQRLHGQGGTPASWALLAIAQHRAGQHAAAAAQLERLRPWLQDSETGTSEPAGPFLPWADRLLLRILAREAE